MTAGIRWPGNKRRAEKFLIVSCFLASKSNISANTNQRWDVNLKLAVKSWGFKQSFLQIEQVGSSLPTLCTGERCLRHRKRAILSLLFLVFATNATSVSMAFL